MKKNQKQNESTRIILKKISWTALILIVYDIGRHIPLPFNDYKMIKQLMINDHLLALSGSATGANLSQISLFSLGLGPWMSAMIIWQLLVMIKKFSFDKLSKREASFFQLLITLFIALIEAWGLLLGLRLVEMNLLKTLIIILTMVSGSFFLIWLANMNAINGIGGTVTVVLFGMIASIAQQVKPIFKVKLTSWNYAFWLILIMIVGLLLILMAVILDKAEYRIIIHRILINNKFNQQTYLPVRLNPGGGMAIMFGLSLLLVPNYLIRILHNFNQQNMLIYWLSKNIGLNSYFGVSIYVIILVSLSIVFGFVNVDAEKISENLRKSGDYIINCQPGVPTQAYLQRYIKLFSTLGAFFTGLIAGCPLYLGVIYSQYSTTLMLPGFLLMSVSMLRMITDQIKTIILLHSYSDLFSD